MTVRMSKHGHAAVGVEIKISILPPNIVPEPFATVAYMDDDSDKISDHKHELADMPSLGVSKQQLLNKRFSIHTHMMEGASIGSGASVFTCTCTPPPIPDDTGKSVVMLRTKLCSREELCSFLRNKLQKQINQQIKRNESKGNL